MKADPPEVAPIPESFTLIRTKEEVVVEEIAPGKIAVKMPLCIRVNEEIKCEPEGYQAIFEVGKAGPTEVKIKYPKV